MNLTCKEISRVSFIIFSVFIFLFFRISDEGSEKIKIGVSDDTSGIVIDYMMKKGVISGDDINRNYESFFLGDC